MGLRLADVEVRAYRELASRRRVQRISPGISADHLGCVADGCWDALCASSPNLAS